MSARRRTPSTGPDPVPGLAPLASPQTGLLVDTTPAIVTGEAVTLDMTASSLPTRLAARIVDALVSLVLLVAGTAIVSKATQTLEEAYQSAATLVATVVALAVFPIAVEALTHGRSLGKVMLGLRVVRDDAGPTRLRHAVIRGLVGTFELWTFAGLPALACAILSRRGKRFGDLLAGTYVVTERPPRRHTATLTMPPALAGWAAGTDLGQIPDPLARAARDVLGRRATMNPQMADALTTDLAGRLSPYVSPMPPPGTPADAFIAAVLAERRDRDAARLVRIRQRRAPRERELRGLPYGLGR